MIVFTAHHCLDAYGLGEVVVGVIVLTYTYSSLCVYMSKVWADLPHVL